MVETYLYEQNLHWQNKLFNAGTERELLPGLMSLMKVDHILAISGVRRCGKSYLMKQLINRLVESGVAPQNILFVNLELPALVGRPAAEVLDKVWNTFQKINDPQGRVYLFLDEIQTLPAWEVWMKYNYDLQKGMIKFVITGSNSRLLSSEFATLLSGRVIEKRLFPFSLRERLLQIGIEYSDPQVRVLQKNKILREFENMVYEGGMPELFDIKDKERKREIVSSYFDTIVYKDIVPRFSVRQSGLLKDLAVYLTGQAASLINLKRLADLFSSNRNSIKEFLSYLNYSLLLSLVEKYDFSPVKREKALKKVYLVDNAFAAFVPLRFSPDRGIFLGNFVSIELLRVQDRVFYWKNQEECDFIVTENGAPRQAIQVCFELNEKNRDREIAGLLAANRGLKTKEHVILTFAQTNKMQAKGIDIKVIPVYQWLLEDSKD